MCIYDVIGADMFGEGVTMAMIADALKQNPSCASVNVRINSPGGDVFEAVGIYNMLKTCGKTVNVVVEGVAASAASIVAMAGDKCEMSPGSMMMIHRAMMMAVGYASDFREAADTLDKVTGSIADIYVAKTGIAKADVLKMQEAETWMTAEEAVGMKFATGIANAPTTPKPTALFDLTVYNNVPASLRASTSRTKRVDGENLTEDCFLYVGDPEKTETWHLPWKFSSEEKTVAHLRDALARFDQTDIPADKKAAVHERLVKLCKEHGIEVSSGMTMAAPAKISNEINLGDRINDVQEALDAKYPAEDPNSCYPGKYWAVDVFETYVIVCEVEDSDEYFRITYTVDADDNVVLGDTLEPVEKTWIPSSPTATARLAARPVADWRIENYRRRIELHRKGR